MISSQTNEKPTKQRSGAFWVLAFALAGLMASGCRQRAFTELYIEKMASEIRMLEDRIYEFDAADQSNIQEIEQLEREIARLRKANEELQRKAGDTKFSPNRTNGDSSRKSEAYEIPSVLFPDSSSSIEIIENPPAVMRSPVAPPVYKENQTPDTSKGLPPDTSKGLGLPPDTSKGLPPDTSKGLGLPPDASKGLPPDTSKGLRLPPIDAEPLLPPPAVGSKLREPQATNNPRSRQNRPDLPSPESLTEEFSLPSTLVRSAQPSKPMVAPVQSPTLAPVDVPSLSTTPSTNAPTLLPKAIRNLQEANPQGSLNRSKIKMPEGSKVQWASATEPIQRDSEDSKRSDIVDNKVSEIGFHPTICRGNNFDETPGDDGLYLVVTPLNAAGQVVNGLGNLTVVVEDSAILDNKGRIARWEFKPQELEEMLTPIGASQGFHLSLPWQDLKPNSPSVTVYLLYELDDGRSMVNNRVIHLRKSSKSQTVWTPRK
ncbi:MAG: hypothetical protein WCK15_20395 [Pirellula sp.]